MSDIPTHPLYKRYCHDWMRYRLAYEGGEEYVHLALAKHEHERSDNFRVRRSRAIYPNHVRSIIDTYAAHLYRDSIAREVEGSAKDILEPFWADIDMLGTPADEFWEEVAQAVQTQGRVAIVTDRYDPDEVETRAQERELGVRPYCYMVSSEDLIDWDVDRRGQIAWACLREVRDQERQPLDDSDALDYQYRVWYPDRWELYIEEKKEGEEEGSTSFRKVDEDAHPVGEVPITMIFWGKRHGRELAADSALKDLEPQNRRLVNLVSLIDEQIHQYVFSLLAVPQSTYDALEAINFSVSGAIVYGDEVSAPPHYISPDIAQITAIRAEIEKTEGTIRHLSGLGRVNSEVKHVTTGIALSYLTFDKDALLAKFAQRMSRAEESVDRHAAGWMEIDRDKLQVKRSYPTSFDPQDLKDSLDAALKTVSLGVTGEALYETQAFALRELLSGRVTGDRLKEILDDLRTKIDKGSPQGA